MGFFSNLFGNGEDKEYRLRLEAELDRLKEETSQTLAKEQQTILELRAKLESEQSDKELMKEEIQQLQEEKKHLQDEMNSQLSEMRKQLDAQTQENDVISRVLIMAQKDADQKLRDAEQEAERITDQAKMDTFIFQQKAEAEMKKRQEAGRKQYVYAKSKLEDRVNVINQSHEKLVEVYNELGMLLQKMPIKMETLYGGEKSDFLLEENFAGEYQEKVIDAEQGS